ncbi:MAG: Si-specific NAD(P)(+) transhydrogenase [bacterium]
MKKYDVIIIGTGPAGEGCSMRLSKEGKTVAVVEDFPEVGGSCTHKGTIPSKALRHLSQRLSDSEMAAISYQDLVKKADFIITEQVKLRKSFYIRNDVDVIHGWARFVNPHSIEVRSPTGVVEKFEAETFVIATGTSPYHPENIDFSHPRILDYNSILDYQGDPKTITIYGAGVIGCEYATILRRMSMKVNLINTGEKLLSFLDDEIIDALSYHLRECGVTVRHNEFLDSVDANDDGVSLNFKSNKVIKSDILVYTLGRVGNTTNMGIENLGLETDGRKLLKVNEFYQTNLKHIYAVGDVVGPPGLASASYDQGRFVAYHIVHGISDYKLLLNMPTGIYTIPEISCVGKTERELTEEKIPYEIGHSFFKHLARSQITGNTTGVLKILFHRDTLEILGVHCFGPEAAEIIHIGQAIMSQKGDANSLLYFVNTTFNYPTMAEAYRVAALNGLNRVDLH